MHFSVKENVIGRALSQQNSGQAVMNGLAAWLPHVLFGFGYLPVTLSLFSHLQNKDKNAYL